MKYFFNKTIQIRRLRKVDANRSTYSATGTAVGYPASIQEPSPDKVQMNEGEIGNMFFCYVDISSPILSGDQITQGGSKYSVRDVKIQDFGSTQYRRITIVKFDGTT